MLSAFHITSNIVCELNFLQNNLEICSLTVQFDDHVAAVESAELSFEILGIRDARDEYRMDGYY